MVRNLLVHFSRVLLAIGKALLGLVIALSGFFGFAFGVLALFNLIGGSWLLATCCAIAAGFCFATLFTWEEDESLKVPATILCAFVAVGLVVAGASAWTPLGLELASEYRALSGDDELGGSSEQEPKPPDKNGQDAQCDPNYSGCIPNTGYDLDCPEIDDFDVEVLGTDTNGFDRDGDGVGCESY